MFGGTKANPLHTFAKVLVPTARVAQPPEIAELALFLAADPAPYPTGAVFPLNGGYSTRRRGARQLMAPRVATSRRASHRSSLRSPPRTP